MFYLEKKVELVKEDDSLSKFYYEWHKTIISDLNRFKLILENYRNNDDKIALINYVNFIINNLFHYRDKDIDDNILVLINTSNYFVFSFVAIGDEINSYVFLSKDYKNIIITREYCELFDREEMEMQDERYGEYDIEYFYLDKEEVHRQSNYKLMYTFDYYGLLIPYNNGKIDKECDIILEKIKRLKNDW